MDNEALLVRLKDHEDGFTERKPEGAGSANAELRKTLVAFANSVPEGKTAILFIGVSDTGTPLGVKNPDSLQKTIREVSERDCFPPITCQVRVFESDGKILLAVLVTTSKERPHFAGPAYVRVGSESVKASPKVYEELIASQNTKAGKILRIKDKHQRIAFRCYELDRWERQRQVFMIECEIEECDAHYVSLYEGASGRHFSVPLERMLIYPDQSKRMMVLEAPVGLWTSSFGM
ncbi:MAG: helix-turn-helix domain-containing protein [Nitrospira sp.]